MARDLNHTKNIYLGIAAAARANLFSSLTAKVRILLISESVGTIKLDDRELTSLPFFSRLPRDATRVGKEEDEGRKSNFSRGL